MHVAAIQLDVVRGCAQHGAVDASEDAAFRWRTVARSDAQPDLRVRKLRIRDENHGRVPRAQVNEVAVEHAV
eukprot:3941243-Rhodomonas_salina.4